MLERVIDLYIKIYYGRTRKPGFKKSAFKNKIAKAFAIVNTLNVEHCPRPMLSICKLCDLESAKPLFNIVKALNIDESELSCLKSQDYRLVNPSPKDYIDVVCAYLNVSFKHASEAYQIAQSIEWKLHGRYPTVLAAACIQYVFDMRKINVEKHLICEMLDCQQRAVNSALEYIRNCINI